jgi:hypothetical protein
MYCHDNRVSMCKYKVEGVPHPTALQKIQTWCKQRRLAGGRQFTAIDIAKDMDLDARSVCRILGQVETVGSYEVSKGVKIWGFTDIVYNPTAHYSASMNRKDRIGAYLSNNYVPGKIVTAMEVGRVLNYNTKDVSFLFRQMDLIEHTDGCWKYKHNADICVAAPAGNVTADRVSAWVKNNYNPGIEFTSREVGGNLNILSATVAHYLERDDLVEKVRSRGNGRANVLWQFVRNKSPAVEVRAERT